MSIQIRGSDAELTPEDVRVVEAFQEIWRRCGRLGRMTYRGVSILKNPVDLFAYQQIVFETRPDVIIETGTAHGGSALFLGDLCELVGHGEVLTVDINPPPQTPAHPRVSYGMGPSTAPETFARVAAWARGRTGMVVLDSDHSFAHVLAEISFYAQLVAPRGYLIVEDTNINGHPIYVGYGPGPWEAVEAFLAQEEPGRWAIDDTREYLSTYNPRGYLRELR